MIFEGNIAKNEVWETRPYISKIVVQSVSQSCLTHYDPMNCSTPGFPLLQYLQELAQTCALSSDAIQPPHPLSLHSLVALRLSQHRGLF